VALFIASVLGSVIGLICMALTGAGRRLALPFAPFLCSGAIIHLFFSNEIIQFYLPSP
jgi:leader peptidase (prepilin peptidase)/N-methyltransferase